MIFVICIHPWPFKLAQVYLITFNALGFIICALGATISCLQILFVIKFSLVFSGNPLKIGRVSLLAVCFVTGIPNLICGLFVITQGIPMGPTVYFLSQTQIKQNSQSISFFINHPWPFGPFFCVCLFFLAFFVIPLVMNKFILLLVGNYMWQAVLQFYQLLWFLLIVNNKQNGDLMPVFMYVYWLYHYILYWQFLWLNLRWKI